MIGKFIDGLVAAYPAQITALENVVDALMPFAILLAILWAVWRWLLAFDRWLERSEAKRLARAREPHYRTADGNKIRREPAGVWQPWHETVPPAQTTPKRAGPAKVLEFPSASSAQQRRSQP